MIFVGIDDTDTLDTPGTNQLARALVMRVADQCALVRITRHQLLFDQRVPYTSKNGSASIILRPHGTVSVADLLEILRVGMREWFKVGSDPGLCLANTVPETIVAFGRCCQRELIRQALSGRLPPEYAAMIEQYYMNIARGRAGITAPPPTNRTP